MMNYGVSFRPHGIQRITDGEGEYDAQGDWVERERSVSNWISCRYEPNGAARTITLPDGNEYRYSYMVYMDADAGVTLSYGEKVMLRSQEGVEFGPFTVKGFHKGQLNARAWL